MIDVCCALIFHRGRLLAVQRHGNTDHPNQWEFPGGKIEPGETAVECIKREIQEELGISVWVKAFLFPVLHDYGTKQIKLFPFVCGMGSDPIVLHEHQKFAWLEVENLHSKDWQEADRLLIQLNCVSGLQWFWQDNED
jgi:8-oxo-dGTP diphosphatase